MKDRHIRLELAQEPAGPAAHTGVVRAVGWDWAARCMDLQLCQGSHIDVAYRIRENDHPDFGGIEIEIAGVRAAEA
jgi:single-stranded-DNA-specific exonuclease